MQILICLMLMFQLLYCGLITPEHFRDHIQGIFSEEYQLYNIELGKTINNHSLTAYVLTKISQIGQNFQQLSNYPASLITSYMHPRQEYTINMISALINKIGTDSNSDYYYQYLLQKSLIIFFPFVNIDGYYRYLQLKQSGSKNINQYRKNMHSLHKCSQQWQQGVDINRNFDYSFGSQLTSALPCSQQYRGGKPFSQKQSMAVKKLYSKFNITIAIDVHSYGNEWIYPYASDPTGQKIKQHKLYPFYQNIVQEFKGKRSNVKGCLQSLGYTADGVYIDWALSQGALSLAFQVGTNFNQDFNINDEVQKSLEQFSFILMKNSISYRIYQNQSAIVIDSLSLLNFIIQIQSSGESLPQIDMQFDLTSGKSLVLQELKHRQKFTFKIKGTPISDQLIVKNIKSKGQPAAHNLKMEQEKGSSSYAFIILFPLTLLVLAIAYYTLNQKKKSTIKFDTQELMTLRKSSF